MLTKTMCSVALLTFGAAFASAQDAKPTPPKPADVTPVKTSAMCLLKSSHVIGAKVENPKGEDLGKIEDVVVDPNSSTIDYAVLSFGGVMGVGDKLFALPWSMLRSGEITEGRRDYRFVLNLDKAKLEKAPGFPKDNWPDSPNWAGDVDKYYGTPPASAVIEANANLRLFRLNKLLGSKIDTTGGDDAGKIKEIVLDPRAGRVSYFVLSSGGFLGVKDKVYAIPWEAVKLSRDKDKAKFVLSIPKEKFDKAPEYKEEDMTRMCDPVWVREVYVYYGFRPYWAGPSEAGYEKPKNPSGDKDKNPPGDKDKPKNPPAKYVKKHKGG
jgi:sporulation protein YlmC with PRC-barrel domain